MQSEQGHHANRMYVDQEGELHLNGSVLLINESGASISDEGIAHSDLMLNSINEFNLKISGTTVLAIDDAAIVSNAASGSLSGKDVFIETQDGGTASADNDGPDGASLTITAGLGSAGGAHTSNNPAGGDSGCISLVTQAGGAAGAGGSGAAGNDGLIRLNGLVITKQGTPTAKTTAVTLTAAELMTRIVTGTHTAGATQAYTLPTGTAMDAALHALVGANEGFEWTLINLSAAAADTITLTANTNHTIVGNAIVQSAHSSTGQLYGNSARFYTRKTAADTFVTYRIA